jgi:multidrug efflux system membrane fusion protein
VIQLDPIRLVGFVPETDVNRVAPGAEAGARLANGETVRGRVVFVGRSADPTTRTFRVEIEVANPDLAIRDGQTAEILIAAAGARGHLLPASALTLDDAGRLGVRSAAEGVVAFHPVSILRDTPEGVWLTGLPETLDVIVLGQEYVVEGSQVRVTLRDSAQ